MTYHLLGKKQTTRWLSVDELALFKIHPPLNVLTVPSWLTVKFHYSLTGPKAKILNTSSPLVASYITLFPVSQVV